MDKPNNTPAWLTWLEYSLPNAVLEHKRYFKEIVCKRDTTRWLLILKVGGAEGPQVAFASGGTLAAAVADLRTKCKNLPTNLRTDRFALADLDKTG